MGVSENEMWVPDAMPGHRVRAEWYTYYQRLPLRIWKVAS